MTAPWEFESRRLERAGLPVWHPSNRWWGWGLSSAALVTAIGAAFGAEGLAMFALQAAAAVVALQLADYSEQRPRLRPRGS